METIVQKSITKPEAAANSPHTDIPAVAASGASQRYVQLLLLVLAAGGIYPLLYLRQVYQTTMLDVLHIDNAQLGYLYSMLGIVFFLSYLPSGWLADRVAPRLLICFSLIGTGALGLWYSTAPAFNALLVIFCCWGLTTGLTFWASVLKRVRMIASPTEQGRFFGLLDGGRGLVEALLATAALALFAAATGSGRGEAAGLRHVIYMYSFTCIALGAVMTLFKDPASAKDEAGKQAADADASLWRDLRTLASIPQLWLMAAVVFCGYQIFWATYSFSAYLQQGDLHMSVVAAGMVTTAKLWMRPIGGIGGGFLGDRFSNLRVLIWAMFLAVAGLVGLILLPAMHNVALLGAVVLFIGLMTYAIRGLYWTLLDYCAVPMRITGLAIGLVSLVGYSSDIFLPLVNGYFTEHYAGLLGYQFYFAYVAAIGALGGIAALVLKRMSHSHTV
ncbi:Inner membrane protein YihN [Paraburkholderia caffeinitolerans]|uniref:Inner membrane protein YihN n=1 Tax=Paraburkholderia caffeinitolerans TaxID=1723730 RepID=A0A6J5G944_9BURK|nr:MFS transporter [Paraburkholderia caffeinitolerans]CAB3794058.1 Inner membrane protein YihN [Paraburkholderia caffeinitolerans]